MMFAQKKMRLVLIVGFVLLTVYKTNAQNFTTDALLMSRFKPAGSARMQALGGAHTALGGDFSTSLSNPAGLGMYNRSEATLSLGLNNYSVSTSYLGTQSKNTNSKVNLPGLSVVLHYDADKESNEGFQGWSLGISLSRTNDINQKYNYHGVNEQSTIIYSFEDYAANVVGDNPQSMLRGNDNYYNLTGLAYNNYIIDTVASASGQYAGRYQSPWDTYPGESRSVNQVESINRRGAQYQWSFAAGANISDKLFLGATVGVTTIRYKLTQTYSEDLRSFESTSGYDPDLRSFTIDEDLDIQGSGINLTLGAIYRPIDFFQLGVSLVTPTVHQITDNYTAGIRSEWINPSEQISESFPEPLLSEYNFNTPLRFSAGASFISEYGFITGSVDFVNYGKAKYSSDVAGIDYDTDNTSIRKTYGSTLNYRLGAEFRYEILRVRAGYAVMGDPYLSGNIVDSKMTTVTGGAGVRLDKFFIDGAVLLSKMDGVRVPYTALGVDDPIANLAYKNTNFVLTVGFSF